MGGPRQIQLAIEAIANHEIDILIGTQIVAKGHNFPMLTLVGVVDGDLGLEAPICARANARSSCCTRSRAAPGVPTALAA